MAAQIDIVNSALAELGEQALSSMSEDSEPAIVANQVYEQVYWDLLSKAPWRFATKKATLSLLVTDPLNEWASQFQMPSDCLRVIRVFPDQDYDIYQDKIYAKSDQLDIDYVYKVDETYLPAYFVRLLVLELAVRTCMAITGNANLKASLNQEKQFQFAAALSADAMQQPNRRIISRPFLDVRY